MSDHLKGLVLTTIGILFVVPDSLFVRLIDADVLTTAFWRGLIAGMVILIAVLAIQGIGAYRTLLRAGWPAVIYIVLIGSTTPAFVMAVSNTSVANVVFIFASMPIFAAVFSRVFLGELIRLRMVLTMLVVFLGLSVIAFGSSTSQIASWKGDLWALYISVVFAAALTAVRKVKEFSMIPAIPIAYVGTALLLWIFVSPAKSFSGQWELFLGHGLIIGAGSCLLALGPRYISSSEVSLLVLLESVLAPILVWFVLGEDPGNWALVGGLIVISALIVSNLVELAGKRSNQAVARPQKRNN